MGEAFAIVNQHGDESKVKPPIEIKPGDTLLYSKSDFFGLLTSFKTFSPAVHVEKYEGNNMSIASRKGIGVNRYDLRLPQLCAVLRPNQPLDMAAVTKWFERQYDSRWGTGVRGRPYGWLDLLRFYNIKLPTSGWICSQFVTSADRAGGLKSFASEYYAGTVDPGDFLLSPVYDWAWVSDEVRNDLTK